jgi:pimeloyl-ACP methyl ester carboxylesterase
MNEQFADLGDVTLCYETFGDRDDPAVLLIMGLGTQMIAWHEDFCRALAERGFFVIRYDNRDVGRSTRFDGVRPPTIGEIIRRRPRELAYTLSDIADDAAGLLDHLGIESAHVVGASMGGMIAQLMAVRHPRRVRSLVSIMSSTGSRFSGQPALRTYPYFMRRPPSGKEAFVDRMVRLFRVIGSPGFDFEEERIRELASLSFDRGADAAGTARQLAAILADGNRAKRLRGVTAPTLVIHGTKDRLVAKSGGRATARAIAGARLKLIEGMGHDLPRALWPQLVDSIVENAGRAATPTAALRGTGAVPS